MNYHSVIFEAEVIGRQSRRRDPVEKERQKLRRPVTQKRYSCARIYSLE